MDSTDLRGITTLLVMISFLGICFWSFSTKNKHRFDSDAQLPFADDDINDDSPQKASDHE